MKAFVSLVNVKKNRIYIYNLTKIIVCGLCKIFSISGVDCVSLFPSKIL